MVNRISCINNYPTQNSLLSLTFDNICLTFFKRQNLIDMLCYAFLPCRIFIYELTNTALILAVREMDPFVLSSLSLYGYNQKCLWGTVDSSFLAKNIMLAKFLVCQKWNLRVLRVFEIFLFTCPKVYAKVLKFLTSIILSSYGYWFDNGTILEAKKS